MLKDFRFPPLELPQLVTEKMKRRYERCISKLNESVSGVGKGSDAFERRKRELWNARKYYRAIQDVMTSPSYIRPLIELWRTEPVFFRECPPCPFLFDLIERLAERTGRGRLTRLPLRELCLLFFVMYDDLPELNALGQLLCRQLDRYDPKELMFGMDKLLTKKNGFFTDKGHDFLAYLADAGHKQPLDVAKEYGIMTNSRFFQKAQQAYYLRRLHNLRPNQEDDLLRQVREENVARQYFDKPRMLGHEVMAVLIDKLLEAGEKPGSLWLDTILAIGDDPRVPPTARSFRIWWQPLGEKRVQAMWDWLSTVDLELFLQICKGYVGESNREDIERMYPPREAFLRSLFKKRNGGMYTHLFLGSGVREYVRRVYKGEKLYYTPLSGNSHLAVFYLKLGNVHIVEGTFSFTLKIMDAIPQNSVLNDQYRYKYYSNRLVPDSRLRKELENAYERAFPNRTNLYCYRHMPNGRWRLEAEAALRRLGVL